MRVEIKGYDVTGTFSDDAVRKGVSVITAKWVFALKIDRDHDSLITKAKVMLVARGFGQKYSADYFEAFAATPPVSSLKVA